MQRVFDKNGKPISLGKEIGRGDEGIVCDIQGYLETVAKIYLKPQGPSHEAKLRAMTEMVSPGLLSLAAWPTHTLHNSSGSVAGFLMPKVAGHRPVFKLYGPKLRLQEFPNADWSFLIHAAANTARAFTTIHSFGFVIGDVNHGNLVVGSDATVRLINCDSFQVAKGGQTWFCEVGVGTHQPPEMQARQTYAGIMRTPNHDNFELAVIIFQLLCMARHPFMGRFLAQGDPPSIEEAIAHSRYAYSRDRRRTAMEPPPGSLPLEALTPDLRDLFEAAFSPKSISGGRPTADRWIPALQGLGSSLRECSFNRSHRYLSGLQQCPWCRIEAASGTPLFPVAFIAAPEASTGIAALWQEVTRLPEPPPLRPLQDPPSVTPTPTVVAARRQARKHQITAYTALAFSGLAAVATAPPLLAFWVGVAVAALTVVIVTTTTAKPTDEQRHNEEIKRQWAALRTEWEIAKQESRFSAIRRELDDIKRKSDDLPNQRASRLQRLSENARQKQFEAYLDRFQIASARIPGVGRAKVATLSSYGIDTAKDVNASRILAIPGFGPATTNKLVAWRTLHAQNFRFDPKQGVSQLDASPVERDIAMARIGLERDLTNGLGRLKAISESVRAYQTTIEGRASELAPQYARAVSDSKSLPINTARYKRLMTLSGALACAVLVFLLSARIGIAITRPSTGPALQFSIAVPTLAKPVPTLLQPMIAPIPVPQGLPTSHSAALPNTNMVVLRQTAYVRQGPDNTAAIVRTAPQGSTFSVYDKRAEWVLVGDSTPIGWIYSGLLEAAP